MNPYSLCLFLREAFWDIPCVDGDHDDVSLDTSIAGLLQHYGFDTAFIDLTSDIRTAGFFSSYKAEVGDIGQLLTIPSKSIMNRFFDLSQEFAPRPRLQSSYVILAPNEFDLKSGDFITNTGSLWTKFKLTEEDKEIFANPDLLSTGNDRIVEHILDWYDNHIIENGDLSKRAIEYFSSAINGLINAIAMAFFDRSEHVCFLET